LAANGVGEYPGPWASARRPWRRLERRIEMV